LLGQIGESQCKNALEAAKIVQWTHFGRGWQRLGWKWQRDQCEDRASLLQNGPTNSNLNERKNTMATKPISTPLAGGLLRNTLLFDAAFSITLSLICLLGAQAVAQWSGLAAPWLMAVGGLVLIYALELGWLTLRTPDLRTIGRVTMLLDVAWVVASIVLLASGWLPLTTAGFWAIVVVADIVGLFAVLKFVDLRRLQVA
jgi:hypothetical protein